MLVEQLQKYTESTEDICKNALLKNSNNFWLALHDLYRPAQSKKYYLSCLVEAKQEDEIVNLLESIAQFYFNSRYYRIWSDIISNHKDFYKIIGKFEEPRVDPDENECSIYVPLLESGNYNITEATLKIIQWIPLEAYDEPLKLILKKILRGDEFMANEALRVISDHPDRVEFFFDDLLYNLTPKRKYNHFLAVHCFNNDNRVFDAIVPLLKKIIKTTRNAQVRDICNDIIERYGIFSKQELEKTEKIAMQKRIEAIHKEVFAIKSAEELHEFAAKYNWDDELECLVAVAMHKLCEKATAKLIYWHSRPAYCQEYTSIDEAPGHRKYDFQIQKIIEEKMKNNEYPIGKISWNPRNDSGYDWTADIKKANKKGIRQIPDFMY